MQTENINLGTEKVNKLLFKLSVPATISLMVAQLYNVIDTIFLGKAIGTTGIGALAIAFPIQTLFLAISAMVASGSSSIAARSFGAQDIEKGKKAAGNGIILCLLISFIMVVFTYIFLDPILIFFGSSKELLSYAKEYVSIVLLGGVLNTFVIVLPELIIASGNSKVSMKATIIGAITNVILDYVFVILLHKGVTGAAIATVIGQIFSSIYVIKHFTGKQSIYKLRLRHLNFDFSLIKEIVYIGIAALVIDASDALMSIVLNRVAGDLQGSLGITIAGIITKITLFMDIPVIGITTGMQPIVSYNFGALRFNRLKNVLICAIKTIIAFSTIFWIGQLAFSRNIISLFINDSTVYKSAITALRITIILFPLGGIYFISTYFYQSLGQGKLALFFSLFKQIGVFIPLVYILCYGTKLSIYGLWLAFPISQLIACIVSAICLRKTIHKLNIVSRKNIKKSFQYVHVFEGHRKE